MKKKSTGRPPHDVHTRITAGQGTIKPDSTPPGGYGFGGKTWRVPQPVPAVSECLELIRAARAGDEYSQWRVEELYDLR